MAELGLLLAHVQKRPQRLELGQVKARRSLRVSHRGAAALGLEPSSAVSQAHVQGAGLDARQLGLEREVHMVCWCCGQQLNLLRHSASS